MDKVVGVGLVGFGYAGKNFHFPLINAEKNMKLYAIVSSKAFFMPEFDGIKITKNFDEMLALDEIQLVVIATPNQLHFDQAKAALNSGKNVVIDKPFALNLAQTQELIALAKSKKLLISCFFNRRWDGDFKTIANLIKNGKIGEIYHFESHFDRFRPTVRDRWRESEKIGGGLWFDIGPHLLDQAIFLFGEPKRIDLNIANMRDGAKNDDWFHAILQYDRMQAVLHSSLLCPKPAQRFTIHGSKGSVYKDGLDAQEANLVKGLPPNSPGFGKDVNPIKFFKLDGDELNEGNIDCESGSYNEFYKKISNALAYGASSPVSPAEIETVAKWHEMGIQSALEKSTI